MFMYFFEKLVKGMGYLIFGCVAQYYKIPELKIRRKCYVMRYVECFSGAVWLLEGEVSNLFLK